MRLAYIDHYDSFTHNLLDWLTQPDSQGRTLAYELIPYDGIPPSLPLTPLVLSPGPGSPDQLMDSSLALAQRALGKVPILGVCLGHQILSVMAGLRVGRSQSPLHGATKTVHRSPGEGGAFDSWQTPVKAASYHSLAAFKTPTKPGWQVSLTDSQDEIQGLEFCPGMVHTAIGVQFHPESFLSDPEPMALLKDYWNQTVFRFFESQL
jgi:anthranilate synthase/aminodeoxychorismate synthase-like glutamine amidotransferase